MNCFNWTYIGDRAEKTRVGLYHSADSGNVMLYCGQNVIVIDFYVHDSKKYTFFIGDELCEVTIERKGNSYYYSMEINTQADTPRNRRRKVIDRKDLVESFAMMGLFVGTIALVYLGLA
jgi:hypothetical protein